MLREVLPNQTSTLLQSPFIGCFSGQIVFARSSVFIHNLWPPATKCNTACNCRVEAAIRHEQVLRRRCALGGAGVRERERRGGGGRERVCCGFLMEIERSWPCYQFEKKDLRLHVQIQKGLGRDLYHDASVCDEALFFIPFPQFLARVSLCGFNNDRCSDSDNRPLSVFMENNRLHIRE